MINSYHNQVLMKAAFLRDMLESENVGMIEIEEAFEQAKEEYLKVIGDE